MKAEDILRISKLKQKVKANLIKQMSLKNARGQKKCEKKMELKRKKEIKKCPKLNKKKDDGQERSD